MDTRPPVAEPLSEPTEGYNRTKIPFALFVRCLDIICRARWIQDRITRNDPEDLIWNEFTTLSREYEDNMTHLLENEEVTVLSLYMREANFCKPKDKYFNIQINSIIQKVSEIRRRAQRQLEQEGD